jgi:hypothetical protein
VLALEGAAMELGAALPFEVGVAAAAAEAAAAAAFLERTRSAHDLGAALGKGLAGSVVLISALAYSWGVAASAAGVAFPDPADVEAGSDEGVLGFAMAGTAGTMGMAGFESFMAWL